MFDFDALDPQRSIVFLPMDGQFSQDVGENLVVDGDFETSPIVPPWATGNSAIAERRTDTPYSGSGYCRITRNGVNTPYIYQTLGSVASRIYHVSARHRAPSALFYITLGGAHVGLAINTPVWQEYDAIAAATSGFFGAFGYNLTGSEYVDVDNLQLYEHPAVTRSIALQPGALNYARMGDGHTAATMPAQLPRRGIRFDGGDYVDLDWAAGGALDTQTFTVCALVQPSTPVADGRIYEIGIAGQRYSLYYDLSEGNVTWQKDDTVDQTITSGYGAAYGQPFVVAASISSSAMKLWVNDRLMGSVIGDVRLPSFDAASIARFGADVAGGNFYKGDILISSVYPFELSDFQVREWGRRSRQLRTV